MKTIKLDCPGIAVRIRPQPDFGCKEIGVLKTDAVVDVHDNVVNGFYQLADGCGYVVANAPGICWHEIPTDSVYSLQPLPPSLPFDCVVFSSTPPTLSENKKGMLPRSPATDNVSSPSISSLGSNSGSPLTNLPRHSVYNFLTLSPQLNATASNDSPSSNNGITTPTSNTSSGIATLSRAESNKLSMKLSTPKQRSLSINSTPTEFMPSYAFTQVESPSGRLYNVPSSPTATRDPKASVAKFMDFDVAEMNFEDKSARPFGWSDTMKYRLTQKEDICRKNGMSEEEIQTTREQREAEEDVLMLQELRVAIRIHVFEKKSSTPVYPKPFHSGLATSRSNSFRGEPKSARSNSESSRSSRSSNTRASTGSIPAEMLSFVSSSSKNLYSPSEALSIGSVTMNGKLQSPSAPSASSSDVVVSQSDIMNALSPTDSTTNTPRTTV